MSCNLTDEIENNKITRNPNPKYKGWYIFETPLTEDQPIEMLWEYENYVFSFNPNIPKTTKRKVTKSEFKEYTNQWNEKTF